jgi:5-formyltetrahydrofolate cyclo-ligase
MARAAADAIEKTRLRELALARRKALSDGARKDAGIAIAGRAMSVIAALRPTSVALYWPIGSECATQPLIAKVEAIGIEIGLPAAVDGRGLVFRHYRPGDRLVGGVFGTREPAPAAPPVRPGLFVLPVVAFDRSGMRLGYGRGYYDSAISSLRDAGQQPRLLGIAFSVQEVEAIPAEPHDVRLDFVVTEKETLEFRTGGPIPTFASLGSTRPSKCRNQDDH